MENGEMVAVCLDRFDNLRGKFIEAGKYGIKIWNSIFSNIYELNMEVIKIAPVTLLYFHRFGQEIFVL